MQKDFLCKILIVFIFLSGMCAGIIQTDSAFSMQTDMAPQKAVISMERLEAPATPCTQEMLGRKSNGVFSTGTLFRYARIYFLNFQNILLILLLYGVGKRHTFFSDCFLFIGKCHRNIMYFIHQKDGKKK